MADAHGERADPWLCATCAVERPPAAAPPRSCPICEDERQYVRPSGQRWLRLSELQAQGHRGSLVTLEPGLLGVRVDPPVGIGQQALLVQTGAGNLLWDPSGYVDDELAGLRLPVVRSAGVSSRSRARTRAGAGAAGRRRCRRA